MKKQKWKRKLIPLVCCSAVMLSTPIYAAGIKMQNVNYDQGNQQLIVKGKVDGLGDVETIVKNLSTGAVLAQGTTDKQFGFKIPIDEFANVPCEVLVLAADQSATAEVKHGPGDCARYEYTLSGVITDEPIPYATVTVVLDGVTYTTTADAEGQYSLPIITANLNQLVKIDASANDPETGDTINFVNMAGSFSRVLDGNANNNVTNVTTASYVLAVEANGGSEPSSVEELQSAETAIDATELFELAALIKLIVDDKDYELPDGEDNLIAFISNPEAVETYIETVPPEDLAAAVEAILDDADLVAGFTIDDIPERYYAIPASSPGYIARQGEALEFNVLSETGTVLGMDGNSGTPIAQAYDFLIDSSGRLVLNFENSIDTWGSPHIDTLENLTASERQQLNDAGIFQIDMITSVNSYIYTRLTDGTLVDIARLETQVTLTFPPIFMGSDTYLELDQSTLYEVQSQEVSLRSSLDIEPKPFTDSCGGSTQSVCATGAWGGIFHYSESPGKFLWSGVPGHDYPATAYGEILTLSAGGSVSGTLTGGDATWSIDTEGALVLAYTDGWTQTLQVLDSLGDEYGIYSDYSKGSERYATYSVYIRSEEVPVLSDQDLISQAGRYYNGEVNTWQKGSFDETGTRGFNNRFGWEFDATGDGRNRSNYLDSCGRQLVITQMGWDLTPENTVVIDRLPTLDWSYPGYAVRTWYPAAMANVDGDRVLYVLEIEHRDDYTDGLDGVKRPLFPARINIQRELDRHTGYDCELIR